MLVIEPLSTRLRESFQVATSLFHEGKLVESGHLLAEINAAHPDHPDVMHLRTVIALKSGNNTDAEKFVKIALAGKPDEPQLLGLMGIVLKRQGDQEGAIVALQKAVAQDPHNADAFLNLGTILKQVERFPEAESAIRKALEIQPHNPAALNNLGNLLRKCDRQEEAIEIFQAAIDAAPDFKEALTNLCHNFLELGQGQDALLVADRLLEVKPGDTYGLAFKSCALQILGERDLLDRLIDIPRLLFNKRIDHPPEYKSLANFNTALGRHLASHPDLTFEPKGKSTRSGSQVSDLRSDPKGPIVFLETILHEAYREYRNALDLDPDHPFAASAPEKYTLDIFGTILTKSGYQNPHAHGGGWLSGVYYVEVPEEITADRPERPGWIEFGRPPPNMKLNQEPFTETRQPEEGALYLFPSYLFHNTVPLMEPARRISIAFDFKPAD